MTTNNDIWIDLADRERDGLDVDGADALAAFYHPFAYAAGAGLGFGLCERRALDLEPSGRSAVR